MDKFEKPIQVTKSFLPSFQEYINKIEEIWTSSWLTNNGPIHNELEKEICTYLKVRYGTLFSNGHLALDIAIKALNLKGEIITTPFTFASTTHAIVMNNIKPIFCDINLKDFTIDVEKIESLITEKTSAILPVHVFGYPCNIKRINEIAEKYKLKVIYDAAHAFGVEIGGKGIGEFGDISMFSFHATKVYNSIEGGALTYNDIKLKEILNKLKNFGITGQESVDYIGLNAKMNEFQAAMGLINLKYINEQINKRKIVAEVYREELAQVKGILFLEDLENIKLNYSYFPILVDESICKISRDELCEELKGYNVFCRKYFYPLVTDFNCYKGSYSDMHLLNAKYVADRILTIPIYGDLKQEEAKKIAQIIKLLID